MSYSFIAQIANTMRHFPIRQLPLLALLTLLLLAGFKATTGQTLPVANKINSITTKQQRWVNYYARELRSYGTVRQLSVSRGRSHNLQCGGKKNHYLRLVTSESTHQGYYPKLRLTYYNRGGEVVAVYTSTTSDIIRIGAQRCFLQVNLNALPTNVDRATLTVLEGEGTLLTVFE